MARVFFSRSVDMNEREGCDNHVAEAGQRSQHLDPDGSGTWRRPLRGQHREALEAFSFHRVPSVAVRHSTCQQAETLSFEI